MAKNPLGNSKVAQYVYDKDKEVMFAKLVDVVEGQRKRLHALEKIVECLEIRPSEDFLFDENEMYKVKSSGNELTVMDFNSGREMGKISTNEVRYFEIGTWKIYYPKQRAVMGVKDEPKLSQKDRLLWDSFGKY